MLRQIIIALLLLPIALGYTGFSAPNDGFTAPFAITFQEAEQAKAITITVEDDAIYYKGYYAYDGEDSWHEFTFAQTQNNGWITSGSASKTITIPKAASTENYIIIYSCSRSVQSPEAQWNCHDGKWQLRQFDTSIEQGLLAEGFEKGLTSPFLEITSDGELAIDTTTAYDGSASLKLTGKGTYHYTVPDTGTQGLVKNIAQGESATLTIMAKGDPTIQGGLMILCLGPNLNYWEEGGDYYWEDVPLTTTWTKHAITTTCPPEAIGIGVRLSVRGAGSVWYDDPTISISQNTDTEPVCGDEKCYQETCTSCPEDCGLCANPLDEGVVIVYYNNFEQDTLGSYRDDEIASDWQGEPYPFSKKGHLSIEQDPYDQENPSKHVRVLHKKGSWGGVSPSEDSGTELYQYLGEGYEELYFSYRIKIEEGFEEHATKGKLPSMEGFLKIVYAGHCVHGDDGFFGSLMFVPVSGGTGIAPYIYHVDMWKSSFNSVMDYEKFGSTCDEVYEAVKDEPGYGGVYGSGETIPSLVMEPGKWHRVTERIVVNELGKNNGIVEIYLDGKLYSQRADYTFRTVENLKINLLSFVSFFGGGEEAAAVEDMNFYFDDFVAYHFKAGYGQPVGNTPSPAGRTLFVIEPA